MHAILGALGRSFARPLIVGTLFPVLLFMVALELSINLFGQKLLSPDDQLIGMSVLLLLLFSTLILYIFNTQILRFLSGYTWQRTYIGGLMKKHHQDKFRQIEHRVFAVNWLSNDLFKKALEARTWVKDYRRNYPHEEKFVLPTAFGNVVRHYDTYGTRQYNLEMAYLWPHLTDVFSKEVLENIQHARTNLDFTANLLVLVIAFGLLHLAVWIPTGSFTVPMISIVLSLVVGFVLYHGAISAAHSWGRLLNGAVDTHRLLLLEKLGIQIKPASLEEERDLWLVISQQLGIGDLEGTSRKNSKPELSYTAPNEVEPNPSTTSSGVELLILKGVEGISWRTTNWKVSIYNPSDKSADNVRYTLTVPVGFALQYSSVANYEVLGGSPYVFILKSIDPKKKKTINYRLMRLSD